ncbi:hypothetical protein [Pseudomonas sp. OV546]|uniref:hypothetical protein n=1 Tax=Pseudomonas sp. OV546 TaxID=1881063 RepID=UPI0008EF3315|nr:hypothetical protein [Pseudomonas sp. OV546]SFU81345.1 hypothetical protein SAMN05428951_104436 [Pseudomonas sp. OV546]
MTFYKEGDKSQAICEDCESVVHTTFQRRNVPFDDGVGEVENVLVAVCDICDRVVAVPAQSTPAIKAARELAVVSVETRLPASYLDRLDYAMNAISAAAATKHRKMFLSVYIDFLARQERAGKAVVCSWKQSDPNSHKGNVGHQVIVRAAPELREQSKRLSLKLNAYIADELLTLQTATKLSRTELFKNMICQMQDDVVNQPKKELVEELKLFARAAV